MTFEDRLAELRKTFGSRSQADRDKLKAAFESGAREDMMEIAHSLAGNGGLFGFPDISAAAHELELAIARGVAGQQLREVVEALLGQLDAIHQSD